MSRFHAQRPRSVMSTGLQHNRTRTAIGNVNRTFCICYLLFKVLRATLIILYFFLLQHCRRPLDFLSFFQEQCAAAEEDPPAIPGVYMTPKDCEYCGATQTKNCDPQTCTRPVLYFQKKRPPFCKPESSKWDPANDHAIVEERRRNSLSAEIKNEEGETDTVLSGRSYFGSFF